ncbi:MAG: efflux RND transporter periplasmic adaptor subunit [Vulcanimicrobiaceae bacterium]
MKRFRTLLLILVALAAIVLVAVILGRNHHNVVPVKLGTVSYRRFIVKLPETGFIEREHVRAIPSLVGGNLEALYVKPGEQVAAGQLLAVVRNTQLESTAAGALADYDSASANIKTARINEQNAKVTYQAAVATARTSLAEARRLYEADRSLYAHKAISQNQLQTDRAKYTQARVAYQQALEQLKLGAVTGYGQNSVQYARAAAKKAAILNGQAQQQLGFTQITAPFSGIILTVLAQPGNPLRSIQVGDPINAGATLFTIARGVSYIVRAKVDEQDISQVHVGQQAIISGEDFAGKKFHGHVTAIAPTAQKSDNPSSTSRQILTTVHLDSTAPFFKDGMAANVDILTTDLAHALVVPDSAIVKKGKKRSVFVVTKGIAKKQPITTGKSNEQLTIVTSGLAAGAQVVLKPPATLLPGAHVTPKPSPSPSPAAAS